MKIDIIRLVQGLFIAGLSDLPGTALVSASQSVKMNRFFGSTRLLRKLSKFMISIGKGYLK